jgi:hypothetical protein
VLSSSISELGTNSSEEWASLGSGSKPAGSAVAADYAPSKIHMWTAFQALSPRRFQFVPERESQQFLSKLILIFYEFFTASSAENFIGFSHLFGLLLAYASTIPVHVFYELTF